MAEDLLCELENIKDKLFHFDTVGFTGLHPAHGGGGGGKERTITSNLTTTPLALKKIVQR